MSDVKIKVIDSDKLINAINDGSYYVNLSAVMALGAVVLDSKRQKTCEYCHEDSEQSRLYKDEVSRQAVKHLDLFTKVYCIDKSATNYLTFRCKQCDFEMPDGKCLVKTMARKICPDFKNFGCMGDL